MKFIDLTGKKFGRLKVLDFYRKNNIIYWNCKCDCGTKKMVNGYHLRSGRILSCGCYSIERISNLNKTHGESKTRLYRIWSGIKTRCFDTKCDCYYRYGGRGITMCKDWQMSYESFRDWALNNGYDKTLTIDRINNNGNYEPNNCRWANNKTQSNNTNRTIILEYKNSKYSIKELATLFNVNYKKFYYGIRKLNYDIDSAIEYAKKYKIKGK